MQEKILRIFDGFLVNRENFFHAKMSCFTVNCNFGISSILTKFGLLGLLNLVNIYICAIASMRVNCTQMKQYVTQSPVGQKSDTYIIKPPTRSESRLRVTPTKTFDTQDGPQCQ